jgi:hypothetical protein
MTNKILLQRVIISDEEESFIDFPLAWKIHIFAKKMNFNKDLILLKFRKGFSLICDLSSVLV